MIATLSRRTGAASSEAVVVFEVSADQVRTWRAASRSGDARYADHDVHLAKPVSEFLGPGSDQISLSVDLDIALGVFPRDEIRTLRELRDVGEVLTFIVGGELVGDYTLRGMSEDWRRVDANGVLTKASVDLTLKEYA